MRTHSCAHRAQSRATDDPTRRDAINRYRYSVSFQSVSQGGLHNDTVCVNAIALSYGKNNE